MKKFTKILLCIFTVSILLIPNYKVEAKTLRQLRNELKSWENQLAATKRKELQTKNEISSAKNSITNKQNQITTNQNRIISATNESEKLTKEIEEGKSQLKELLEAYQMAEGSNVYLEYVFDATSYEDLVYRYSVIEQVMDYINGEIDKWNGKIEHNTQLKKELSALEIKLNSQIDNLTEEIDLLGEELDKFDDAKMEIKDEINSTKDSIKTYEQIGCKEDEDLKECLAKNSAKGWVKPLTKGVITSYFGYRVSPITGKANQYHSGTDIGGNKEGTAVYSMASGTVGKIIKKASCGGNQVYVYHTVLGKRYTSCYMHLLTINVKVGQTVDVNTVVGTVGGGKGTKGWEHCSTGAHLHLGLGTGWYGVDYLNYSSWKARLISAAEALKLPAKGKYWYARY